MPQLAMLGLQFPVRYGLLLIAPAFVMQCFFGVPRRSWCDWARKEGPERQDSCSEGEH